PLFVPPPPSGNQHPALLECEDCTLMAGYRSLRTLAREGRMTVIIGRRELLAALGGAAAAWPLAARAQQPERMRRIGVLSGRAADDQDNKGRPAAFQQRLQQLGWKPQCADLLSLCRSQCRKLSQYAPGHPHGADRVHVLCRSGRLRPRRKSVAAGRQRHWLLAVRIRFERKMAGAA